MVFGWKEVKCPHCGHKFKAPLAEWNATAMLAPVNCPHCGEAVHMDYRPKLFERLRRLWNKSGKKR